MSKKKISNHKLAYMSLMMGIMLVLGVTPIGSIPLPFMKATTTQIPVILAACFWGVGAGSLFGIGFGAISMIRSTLMPNLTSFAFSPFVPIPGSDSGSWKALLIAFVPRILIGIVTAELYKILKRTKMKNKWNLFICGFVGSIVNTVFVLVFIYILLGESYAQAQGISYNTLVSMLVTVIFTNGIAEAAISGILVPMIGSVTFKVFPDIVND